MPSTRALLFDVLRPVTKELAVPNLLHWLPRHGYMRGGHKPVTALERLLSSRKMLLVLITAVA